jgi:hypothetical protein
MILYQTAVFTVTVKQPLRLSINVSNTTQHIDDRKVTV